MCHFTDVAMLTTLFELADLHQGGVSNDGTTSARGTSHACGARGNNPAALNGGTDTGSSAYGIKLVLTARTRRCIGCHEEKQRSWRHIFLGRGDAGVSPSNAHASYWNTFGKRWDKEVSCMKSR
ncbi:hypothetical protein BDR03DRAFT_597959 [Suillus americanus]|nr:hypothetical protein BDR03DRAFT_597959 [Suillus americanus]